MVSVENKGIKIIGPYTLKFEIGRGTYGVVYYAEPPSAIKMIKREQYMDKNLKQEIKTCAVADHPNLLKMHTLLTTRNNYYFVFEYCDRGDLYNYIKTHGPSIPLLKRIRFIKQVINGYTYLYDHRIMHRDIKPENILLKSEGGTTIAKIGDFGFAKQFTEKELNEVYLKSIVGTPIAMSPEIYFEKHYNVEADIWSLGILFYFIIFESFPFPAKTRPELAFMLENKEYIMDLHKRSISYEAMLLISNCLQTKVETRITPEQLKAHPIMSASDDDLMKTQRSGFKMSMRSDKCDVINKEEWMKL